MSKLVDSENIPVSSSNNIDKDAFWFEALLKSMDIYINKSSLLAKDIGNMKLFGRAARGELDLSVNDETPTFFKRVLGISFIIKAIHRALKTPAAKSISSKLKLFHGSDILFTTDSDQSQERDYAWELLIGCLCSTFCNSLTFGEPDLLYQYRNVDWAIACKVLYSKNRDQQIKRIIDGVKQIEKSTAQYGIVVVNVTNLLDHAKFSANKPLKNGESFSFNNPNHPLNMLENELKGIADKIRGFKLNQRLTVDLGTREFRYKTRMLILLGQTVTITEKMPTLLTYCVRYSFRKMYWEAEQDFFKEFNSSGRTVQSHQIGVADANSG